MQPLGTTLRPFGSRRACPPEPSETTLIALDHATLGTWSANMSKTTLSILSTILLGSAFALSPTTSMARATAVRHVFWHSPLARFAEHRAERDALRVHKSAVKSAAHRPIRLDSRYIIIDHPNA